MSDVLGRTRPASDFRFSDLEIPFFLTPAHGDRWSRRVDSKDSRESNMGIPMADRAYSYDIIGSILSSEREAVVFIIQLSCDILWHSPAHKTDRLSCNRQVAVYLFR